MAADVPQNTGMFKDISGGVLNVFPGHFSSMFLQRPQDQDGPVHIWISCTLFNPFFNPRACQEQFSDDLFDSHPAVLHPSEMPLSP